MVAGHIEGALGNVYARVELSRKSCRTIAGLGKVRLINTSVRWGPGLSLLRAIMRGYTVGKTVQQVPRANVWLFAYAMASGQYE
jgi:hypothetical protein